MAGRVRATLTVTYPLGSPESYGGEATVTGQLFQERAFLEGSDGYLLDVLSLDEASIDIVLVEEV